MQNELLYKIALGQIPLVGSITAKLLVAKLGGVEAVFKEKKKNLLKIPGIGDVIASSITQGEHLKNAEKEIEFIEKYKIKASFYLDPDYPNRLRHCEDSPVIFYYKGDVDFNAEKTLSFVGTRSATEYGKQLCENFIAKLTERGYNPIIISGLAYGIDITAHKAALQNNLKTIAVLAHGFSFLYPAAHRSVAKRIVEQGCLLTDFANYEKPIPGNFIKRNRIIAGLADATIVVESGEKGGALITADIANSYNRDVFAFPGKVSDTWSKGCNRLIKTNKAALLEDIADLEYLLGWESPTEKSTQLVVQKQLFSELTEEESKLYDLLRIENEPNGLPIDYICHKAELSVSKVSPVLLNLEFKGIIKSLPGKIYKLR